MTWKKQTRLYKDGRKELWTVNEEEGLALNLEITPDLKMKGHQRDIFRLVSMLRKHYNLKETEPLIIKKGKEKLKIEKWT